MFFTSVCLAFTLLSCSTVKNTVIKHEYDFSVVKNVRVGHFSSASYKGQVGIDGAAARAAFIRWLLIRGYTVVSDYAVVDNTNVEVDAVIEGSIIKFCIEKTDDTSRASFISERDVYYDPGSCDYDRYIENKNKDRNAALSGLSQVLSYYCGEPFVIGISAHMTDIKTGQIVWSSSCSEKDRDIDFAVNKVVRRILISLPKQ